MRWLSWLGAVALCIVIGAGLGLYKYNDIQAAIAAAAAFPEPSSSVEVYTVEELRDRPDVVVHQLRRLLDL